MQKIRMFALVALCVPSLLLAGSFFSQDTTAKQEYRDINSQRNVALAANQKNSASAQQESQASNAQQATDSNASDQPLESNDQRMAYLSSKTENIILQIKNLNQMVEMLAQESSQMKATQSQLLAEQNMPFIPRFLNWLHKVGPAAYLNLGGAALFLIIFGFLLGRLRRPAASSPVIVDSRPSSQSAEDAPDTDAEYDFMATEEAIPAQLDLARSYLAMDDNEQAVTVLNMVVAKGNDDQKREAQELLDEIAKKTKADRA